MRIEKLNLVGHSFARRPRRDVRIQASKHTASLVALNPGPPFVPELMQSFQQTMGTRRSPEDDEESRAISRAETRRGWRDTFSTAIPFFSNRAHRDACELGFTEITAANVGKAPERMFRDLADLDPIGSLADITCPSLYESRGLVAGADGAERYLTWKRNIVQE